MAGTLQLAGCSTSLRTPVRPSAARRSGAARCGRRRWCAAADSRLRWAHHLTDLHRFVDSAEEPRPCNSDRRPDAHSSSTGQHRVQPDPATRCTRLAYAGWARDVRSGPASPCSSRPLATTSPLSTPEHAPNVSFGRSYPTGLDFTTATWPARATGSSPEQRAHAVSQDPMGPQRRRLASRSQARDGSSPCGTSITPASPIARPVRRETRSNSPTRALRIVSRVRPPTPPTPSSPRR